jgi:hypothetical protein
MLLDDVISKNPLLLNVSVSVAYQNHIGDIGISAKNKTLENHISI